MQAPVGTCYEDAWRFLIREEEGELVHGSIQTIGKRINHAWVELPTGFVWEPESGEFMKKSYFYERAEPQVQARYTAEEAAIMLVRVGKHGPWTEEEREQFLKEGNPDNTWTCPECGRINQIYPYPTRCSHCGYLRKVEKEGGNPDRVRFDRASIDSAIAAAKRLQSEKDQYIFATYLGYTIESRPPPGMQQYVIVHPDGTTEIVKPQIGGNPLEPWQMTQKEFIALHPEFPHPEIQHRGLVFQALRLGEEVPPEVMTDYPDMPRPNLPQGGNPMKTDAERKSFHERIFGKGSTPPLERLGRGQVVTNLTPMPPEEVCSLLYIPDR